MNNLYLDLHLDQTRASDQIHQTGILTCWFRDEIETSLSISWIVLFIPLYYLNTPIRSLALMIDE